MMKNRFFVYLTGFVALLLAGVAAYFSVVGLTKFLTGVTLQISIMASVIEAGKLVAATALKRMWKQLGFWRIPLLLSTLFVMVITSLGVYGFLSAAYEKTSSQLKVSDKQIQIEESKKEVIYKKIASYEEAIQRKQKRGESLVDLRGQQENRVDSLLNKNWSTSARKVQESISEATKEIKRLDIEVDSLNSLISDSYKDIASIDSAVVVMKSSEIQGEIGPIKYIARVTGMELDRVANYFIFLLVAVFDPLAIMLLTVFNIGIARIQREKEEEKERENKGNEVGSIIDGDEIKDGGELNDDQKSQLKLYKTDDSGDFVALEPEENEKVDSQFTMKDQGELYWPLLDLIYESGKKGVNDDLPPFSELYETAKKKISTSITEKEITDFLQICLLHKVIKIETLEDNNTLATLIRSYDSSKKLFNYLFG